MKIILLVFSFLFFLGFLAQATPLLHDITPVNNSYSYGRDTDIFSTKITESDLNVSSAYLHIRVDDPTSLWSNISMSSNCVSSSSEWSCNTTVSGLSALLGDGNTLLYFFDAYANDGSYDSSGTADGPNRVKIDRRGPTINFTNPTNNSYVGNGNLTIKIKIEDSLSGVNSSSVGYSFDNSTWFSTSQDGSIFSSSQLWDITSYSNNQTVTIYAKAFDNLGNANYKYINVTVDNEVPRMIVLMPAANQILYDSAYFSFSAEDSYSGLDNTTATFNIAGASSKFVCNGTDYKLSCSFNFNTKNVSDGPYNVTFSIKDRANNLAQNSTPVIVDNNPPTLSITSPSNNAEVSGVVTLTASVTDAGTGVNNVSFRWESGSTTGNWSLLYCAGNLRSVSCSGYWNSTGFSDGIYTLRFSANDSLSRQTITGVTVRVKNAVQTSTSGSSTNNTVSGSETTSTTLTESGLVTTTTLSNSASGTSAITKKIVDIFEEWQIFAKKNWVPTVVVIAIAVAIILVYFFWPKKTSVYLGYKPKKSFKLPI
jgi:hypothetical protein